MQKYLPLLVSLFCLLCIPAGAQTKRFIHKLGIEGTPAYILPTNPFLKGYNAGNTPIRFGYSLHVKYAFQFRPGSETGRIYKGAYQGVGLAYNNFREPQYLGNPVTAYVFQGARIAQLAPRLSFNYEWKFGASFGWKPYDENQNYYNRVIGSKINAYLNAGFYLNWSPASTIDLFAGVDFTHYSNGNTRYPNSGLNSSGGKIGIIYNLNRTKQEIQPASSLSLPDFRQHISCDVVLYGAWRRKGVFIDDQGYLAPGAFGVLGFNVNPMYNLTHRLKAGISLDGQYDESANIENYIAAPEETDNLKFYRPSLQEQIGVGLSARVEYVMPYFSINFGIGKNFIGKGEDLKGIYQILALKLSVTRNFFLHIGYQLHDFRNPNNLMLGIGYRFNNQRQIR